MRMLRLRGIVLPRWSFTTDNQSVPLKCEQFNASLRLRDSQFNVHVFTIILMFPGFSRKIRVGENDLALAEERGSMELSFTWMANVRTLERLFRASLQHG